MSPPTKELMHLTLEHNLAHGGHSVLRWNMDNVFVRTDPAGNIKPDLAAFFSVLRRRTPLDVAPKRLRYGSLPDEKILVIYLEFLTWRSTRPSNPDGNM